MKKESKYNMMLFVIISIVCLLLGLLLQFVEQIQPKTLCYLICFAFTGIGILEVSKFFLTKAYKRLDDYSFTLGLMAIILSLVGVVRINDIVPFVLTILIIPCLFIGMILFQYAIQLNALHKSYWIAELVACIVVVVGSVLALLGVSWIQDMMTYLNYLLIASGVLGLISYIIVYFSVRSVNKKEMMENEIPPEPHHNHPPEIPHEGMPEIDLGKKEHKPIRDEHKKI